VGGNPLSSQIIETRQERYCHPSLPQPKEVVEWKHSYRRKFPVKGSLILDGIFFGGDMAVADWDKNRGEAANRGAGTLGSPIIASGGEAFHFRDTHIG